MEDPLFGEASGSVADWLRREYEAGRMTLDEVAEAATTKPYNITVAFRSCLYLLDEKALADVFGEVELRTFGNTIGFGFAVRHDVNPTLFTPKERGAIIRVMAAILNTGGVEAEVDGDSLSIEGVRVYAPFDEEIEQFVAEIDETLGPDYRPDDDGWNRWKGRR